MNDEKLGISRAVPDYILTGPDAQTIVMREWDDMRQALGYALASKLADGSRYVVQFRSSVYPYLIRDNERMSPVDNPTSVADAVTAARAVGARELELRLEAIVTQVREQRIVFPTIDQMPTVYIWAEAWSELRRRAKWWIKSRPRAISRRLKSAYESVDKFLQSFWGDMRPPDDGEIQGLVKRPDGEWCDTCGTVHRKSIR